MKELFPLSERISRFFPWGFSIRGRDTSQPSVPTAIDVKSPDPNTIDYQLPGNQSQLFVWFWHVVFLAGSTIVLGISLWNARSGWGLREVFLVGLVAMQVALYLKFNVFTTICSLNRSLLYFALIIPLWFLAWQLEPAFGWFGLSFIGQMYGILPIRLSLPASALLALVWIGEEMGWQRFFDLSLQRVLGIAGPIVTMSVLALYIYHLATTSIERGKLITQLQVAQKELEQARRRDAEMATLRERERLARDMHDGLGHTLAALSIQLEAVQRLYPLNPAKASYLVDEMKGQVRGGMAELRRSLAGLRTPGLGERPLVRALQELSIDIGQRAGVDVTSRIDPASNHLPPAVSEVFWRVAQEALTNVERHAQARNISIELKVEQQQAILRIADDGIGILSQNRGSVDGMPLVETSDIPGHYGLMGMRERMAGVGGQLVITGNAPQGTLVEARTPIWQPSLPRDSMGK
ncbi:MAG: sensor histidine kinase [Chloroflexi bacterium]|nr:sensor histidine kinase [Chloroflexota bacterium]